MTSINVSQALQVSEYKRSLDKVPMEVLYQNYPSQSASINQITWNIQAPTPNALLDSEAYVELKFNINHGAGAIAHGDRSYWRQLSIINDCIDSITWSCNGAVITNQMGEVSNALLQNYIGENDATKIFANEGGNFNKYDGFYDLLGETAVKTALGNRCLGDDLQGDTGNSQNGRFSCINRDHEMDTGMEKRGKVLVLGDDDAARTYLVRARISIPPFNWLKGTKTKKDCVYYKMSETIPYLQNGFQLTMRFKSGHYVGRGIGLFRDMVAGAHGNANPTVTLLNDANNAVLKAKFYIPSFNYKLPQAVALPIWDYVNYQVKKDLVIAGDTIESRYLNVNQMPDKLFIFISPDRTLWANNYGAGEANGVPTITQKGKFFPIETVQISLNSKSAVISSNILSTKDLYDITKKNLSHNDIFPYNYNTWKAYACVIVLNQTDLANLGITSGVSGSVALQVRVTTPNIANYQIRDSQVAHAGLNVVPPVYLNVCPFYTKKYLIMTENQAKIENQTIDPVVARQELNRGAPMIVPGVQGAAIRTGGRYKRRI